MATGNTELQYTLYACAMDQAIICRSVTQDTQVRTQTRLCRIRGGHIGIGIEFSSSVSDLPYQ